MTVASASWEFGRYRPYDPHELLELENLYCTRLSLGLNLRRALACRTSGDLEWTVLVVPGLTSLLDEAMAGYGGTWPIRTVAAALAERACDVDAHADSWAEGSIVSGPPILELLACTRARPPRVT